MQLQPSNHAQRRQLAIAIVATYGLSILGGGIGLIVGRQADTIFNVDAGIIGMVTGATISSLLPLSSPLNPILRFAAAGLGVALPMLVFVGSSRVAPEVFWGMIVLAMCCSGLISLLTRLLPVIRTIQVR
jgi:hypothetical protein